MNKIINKVFLGLSTMAALGLVACESTPEEREYSEADSEFSDTYADREPASSDTTMGSAKNDTGSQMYSEGQRDKQYFDESAATDETTGWSTDKNKAGQAVTSTRSSQVGMKNRNPYASNSAMMNPDRTIVKEVQQALNDEGHDLAVDGILGTHTRNALSSFQSQNGIRANGQLNARTLEALGVDGERAPASIDESETTTDDYDSSWE